MIEIEKTPDETRLLIHDGQYRGAFMAKYEYDQLVTDLEAKARELWPDKFPKDHTKDFELIHHSDGSTECRKITIAEHESIREQDRLNRTHQIPIRSRK